MPSFIDCHSNLTKLASILNLIPLSEIKNFNNIINILNDFNSKKVLNNESSGTITKPELSAMCEFINIAQDIYLSYGITTVQDTFICEEDFDILKYISSNNNLKFDLIAYIDLKNSKQICDNNKSYIKNYIDRLKIGGYTLILDGSLNENNAWLSRPYKTSRDNYRGNPIYNDSEVRNLISSALSENMQLLTTCNGDAACEQLIDSFRKSLSISPNKRITRPIMVNAQTLNYMQLDKMKKINMMPSYFIANSYHFGDALIESLGTERAFRLSPLKTTIDKKLKFTINETSQSLLPNIFESVWCAVNRLTKNGTSIGESEIITPIDALKGVTINAAYQYFEEDIKGSIKEGKFANLIILDNNPLTINPTEIKNIKVLQTIREGQTLYKREN
jgi:predicted amidohydrolase YtcJ